MDILPENNILTYSSFNKKKLLKTFNLEYEKIDVVLMIFVYSEKRNNNWNHVQNVQNHDGKLIIAQKQGSKWGFCKRVMLFSIIPQFKRMFQPIQMIEQLTWHSNHKSNGSRMRHLVDSPACHTIDKK